MLAQQMDTMVNQINGLGTGYYTLTKIDFFVRQCY